MLFDVALETNVFICCIAPKQAAVQLFNVLKLIVLIYGLSIISVVIVTFCTIYNYAENVFTNGTEVFVMLANYNLPAMLLNPPFCFI
jgi:hypothetical protein